ncbi:MAG TPA: 50S ribosomal protein L11 methyltransferase [Candidatus Gastranaerophilales bacterium]|nr:50S ribosomal protein L11 methyltransferase [Candidatus Gastranaerophilales bacterium]
MNKHIEILVNINPVWAEYVSELLINKIGCLGIVTEEKEFKDEKIIKADLETVKGYLPFTEDFDLEKIRIILQKDRQDLIFSGIKEETLGNWSVISREIKEEEWADNWKKFWHPQKIGSKIVICPTWEDYKQKDDEIIIKLDPGSAFGTGTHPTTRLCLTALEKISDELNGEFSVADVGMGSGILAITGIKLGAYNATGVDNDASVISVAIDNAKKNNVEDKCRFFTGSAKDIQGEYDIVVANILTEVLVTIMSDLEKLLKPEGILILSGIIKRKLPEIETALEKNLLKIKEVPEEENWVAPIVTRIKADL